MSELIDRQALRAAHGLGADCHDCKRDMKSCQYDRDYSLMDFCEWLDDAPTASPWHRVEEPPKEEGRYLVRDVDGFAYVDTWEEGKWLIASSVPETNISTWMPLPEPPKEEVYG